MTDKHTKDAKDSKHGSHSHKHASHDTKHHDHSDHDSKEHKHSGHGSHDSKHHKSGSHAKHEAKSAAEEPKAEAKSEPKVSHVSRSEPARASQGSSPWLVVSIVLGVLLLGSLATGGYSDFPDWNPGFNTGDQRSSGEFNLDGAYAKGDENAEVTIIEYSDFECPFCARWYSDTLPQIEENYIETGQVKLVYKHFPLSIHPNADDAAEATECAGDQGSFYDMHDVLFERQSSWARDSDPTDTFVGYAEELGLNANEFRSCLESGEYADKVQADFQEGSQAGVRGTPAFFINGRMISGAQPYSVFREAIEAALAGEAPAPEPTPEPAQDERIELSRDQVTGYQQGSEDAEVVILEWSSYHCPFCGRHHTQTKPLIDENYIETGQVQLFYHDFDFQPKSKIAATAARCAGEQVDYFDYQKLLYDNQNEWSSASESATRDYYIGYAEELGADTEAFAECYDDDSYADEIAAESALGRSVGVSGTPSFLIGNFDDGFQRVVGAQPYAAFEQVLEEELAAAE